MKELTFHRWLLRAVERRASETAFVDQGVPEDVSTHVERTLRLVSAFADLGAREGDRVAIVADASRYFANVMHAAALGGMIAAPLNIRLAIPELAEVVAGCEPAIVVTDVGHQELTRAALQAAGLSPAVVLIDGPPGDGEFDLLELAAGGEATVPPEPEEEAVLLMLFTGGTSGASKGAMIDNRQLLLQLYRQHLMSRTMDPGMVVLSTNPMFHIGGVFNGIYGFPAVGNTVVMRPSFDPDLVLADADAYAITHLPSVVTILQRILEHPKFDAKAFSALRYIYYGGSAIPPKLLDRIIETFPGVHLQQNYGMTEAVGAVTCLDKEDHEVGGERLSSVGRPCPGVLITVRDADGVEVPTGTTGEICVHSGSATIRYWGRPYDPAAEWFATGDAGRFDDDGYLYIVDRYKDMIITGGENVYSVEVETVLLRHPDVQSAAVIGLPDEAWGERVHAIVVPMADTTLTLEGLREFAREQLAGYKLPKSMDLRSAPLPTSTLGKVLKRALREEYGSSSTDG